MRLHLIRDIYIYIYIYYTSHINSNLNSFTKFTNSSRNTNLKDIFPWNISQMIMKTVPISTRIVISYTMKYGSSSEFYEKSMETETTT